MSTRNLLKKLLLLFFGLATCAAGFAQEEDEDTECVRTLRKAQKTYDDGLIEQVDQMLRPCLSGGQLSKEDKMEAYKLIAMAHTYDGKDDEAEAAMLEFLRLDPEYEIQPGVDPKEFVELYGNYHTDPLYTIGIYGGPNWASAQSYKEYGAYNTETDKKQYSSNVGFQIGLRGTRYLYKGLNLHLDLTYMQSSFKYNQDILESYTNVDPNDDPVNNPQGGVSMESVELHQALSIPISLSYTFMSQKQLRPYVLAGFEIRYLLSASNEVQKSYLDPNIASVEIPDIENFQNSRNDLTFSGVFAAGAKYKIPRGDLFIEARYHLGISDQVKRDQTPINEDERIWNFYQQDNDFTLNTLLFSIGYNYYLYKPRRMKEEDAYVEEKPKKEKKEKEKKNKDSENQPSENRQIIE